MKGTIANTAAIVAGAGLGLMLQKGIPEGCKTTLMHGLGLAVLIIGIQMAIKTENILVLIISIVIGTLLGEWWKLDNKLLQLGAWLEQKFNATPGQFSKGFVSCSLIYCVGAMAVVGAIQDGMTGNAEVLYAKAMLDGISAVIFSSTLGIGVLLSAGPVLVYQGSITLLAKFAGPFISPAAVAEMTAVGGLLIICIALNMLEINRIKVANMLPAVFVAMGLAMFVK